MIVEENRGNWSAASTTHNIDHHRRGRTLQYAGEEGLPARKTLHYVETGQNHRGACGPVCFTIPQQYPAGVEPGAGRTGFRSQEELCHTQWVIP